MQLYNFVDSATDILAPIFRLFGWEWADKGVPSHSQIRAHIEEALETLLSDKKIDSTSSGRIMLEKEYDEEQFYGVNIYLNIGHLYHDNVEKLKEEVKNL